METVYQGTGIEAKFDEKRNHMWVGLSTCPTNEEIDKMWMVLSTFVNNYPRRCILHLVHVDTPELEPPQLPTLIHVVSKIMNDFTDMRKKCKQIIVQPKYIDDKVLFAQQIFVGLIKSKLPLEISDKQETVDRLIDKLNEKEKK